MAIRCSGYREPAAAPCGATSSIRFKSRCESLTFRAPAFSSRYLRRLVPGIGMMSCRSEEHTSELQSHSELVCRLLLEKKKLSLNAFSLHCAPITNHILPFFSIFKKRVFMLISVQQQYGFLRPLN